VEIYLRVRSIAYTRFSDVKIDWDVRHKPATRFFLATLDDRITTEQIGEMRRKKVYLVVPAAMKASTVYAHEPNVISFEDFFADHLDPAVARWKKHKII
jgi:hypothetical protein